MKVEEGDILGLFTRDENYNVSYYLVDKKFDATEIKQYNKIESLKHFLEKAEYSLTDIEQFLISKNPFDTVFNTLRFPFSNSLADEHDRMKKIIVINTIEGFKNSEQKYSFLNSIVTYFIYLICLRYGITQIGERRIDISEKKQFIKELSSNNTRSLMWFDEDVAICIAIYIKEFNLTLPEFATEFKETYSNNIGIPKSILGTDDELLAISFKILELLTQKKKYRISNILK